MKKDREREEGIARKRMKKKRKIFNQRDKFFFLRK